MEPTNEPSTSKPTVPPITAPTGIDLHPAPRPTVRISKRAGIAIISVLALLMLGLAWGGYRRSFQNQATARQAGLPRSVTPAHADDQLLHGIPPADASLVHPPNGLVPKGPDLLQAPNLTGFPNVGPGAALNSAAPCGFDATGMPMRFNPQTGQPCDLPWSAWSCANRRPECLTAVARLSPLRHPKITPATLPGSLSTKPCWRPPRRVAARPSVPV